MKIELKEITVDELTKDYRDNDEQGVIGYAKTTIEENLENNVQYDI